MDFKGKGEMLSLRRNIRELKFLKPSFSHHVVRKAYHGVERGVVGGLGVDESGRFIHVHNLPRQHSPPQLLQSNDYFPLAPVFSVPLAQFAQIVLDIQLKPSVREYSQSLPESKCIKKGVLQDLHVEITFGACSGHLYSEVPRRSWKGNLEHNGLGGG